MSRTSRLFDLIQTLRAHRHAVTAAALAEALQVSKRTIHRDLDTLRALGAPIEGEAGIGYLLRPGFLLPPLMLTEDELEALALGALWVRQRADKALSSAACDALAKIGAVLPQALTPVLETPSLLTVATCEPPADTVDVADLRRAIRERRKLKVGYVTEDGATSTRVLWPIALVYFEQVKLLAAWCEMRESFRHFRTDRLNPAAVMQDRYLASRAQLMKAWRLQDRRTDLGPPSSRSVDGN